jgi:hypothetical protein
MRIVCVALAMIVMTGASSAQPSLSPPIMTSPVDRVSDDDDVTEIQRIMGPTVAFTVGFGLGPVVEGRWLEKGWIFTAGETAGVALWMGGYMMDMSCETMPCASSTSFVWTLSAPSAGAVELSSANTV